MISPARVVVFLVVAVAHLVLTLTFFLRAVGTALEGLDTAEPYTASEQVVATIADILMFPLVTLAGSLPNFLGPLADLSFVLNSLLWSAAICFGIPFVLRRISGRREA